MSQSSQSYSPCPTCYRRRCRWRAHCHPPHSCRAHLVMLIASCSSRRAHRVVLIVSCSSCLAHHVVLNASCSSRRAHRVMSYLPTFLCFHTKCGGSIYRYTLDIMNGTGLSHYAWNPLRVCECDKSICGDVPCVDRQRDRGAMTCVIQMPFALTRCVQKENTLTRLRPEGKCPDMLCLVSRCHGELSPDARCHGELRPDVQCHGELSPS